MDILHEIFASDEIEYPRELVTGCIAVYTHDWKHWFKLEEMSQELGDDYDGWCVITDQGNEEDASVYGIIDRINDYLGQFEE